MAGLAAFVNSSEILSDTALGFGMERFASYLVRDESKVEGGCE